jgi:hypothetical protein
MNSFRIHSLLILAILTFLIVPASATHQLQNVTITPASEAIPAGTRVNLTAIIQIIPPGPTTTFVEWDDLVLGTELENPRWDVVAQVDNRMVDGNPEGSSRVKVPGYLLSYDVDKNVAVRVQLDGNVPISQDPRTFIVLSIDEQNDRGVSVGSPEYVTRAILPTTRVETLSATPSPIKTTAGISLLPVIAGLVGAAVLLGWRRD